MGEKLNLFDEEENEDVSKIEIDKEYAKRLEHNKRREDLQRYEELKKRGVIEESDEESDESTDEDEDNNEIVGSSKGDLKFINALLLVKKQDPSLKEKDIKLFESESDGREDEDEKNGNGGGKMEEKKKKNAMYLKDVMAKHLIEEGPEFREEEEEELSEKKKRKKSYTEEQEEMRKAFLDAVKEAEENEEEEEDGFLKERKREKNDEEVDDDNEEFVKKLDEYFGGDGELDENQMFLREFFKNKMWVDEEKKDKVEIDEDEVEELLREDEELERQEVYETNFRHEEGVDDRVMGHSRKVEGSVRKKENARKEQRKSKEERMRIAEVERQEELKHLKNLKKKEMKEKMTKVMAIAGFNEDEDLPLNLKDLDDEFDPDEYDKMMKTVFSDKYYNAEDVDPEFGFNREGDDEDEIEKPDFDKEDELLGLPKGWDVIESGDGFRAARERSLKHKLENGGDDDDESEREKEEGTDDDDSEREEEEGTDDDNSEREGGEGEREVYEESKRKRKRKMSLVKRAKEEMLEEFYKLDYEDTIGDLRTRFKYAKVKPNRFGLKTEEMLMMEDEELNQYVSLKKLAPYREKEWKVPDVKRHQQKLKNKELLQGHKSDDWKKGKRKRSNAETSTLEMGAKGDEKAHLEEPDTNVGNLSKRAKTRRRQAKPKLSQSRLIAYGKIPSKAKSKVKH